jgi:cytidylate kinase
MPVIAMAQETGALGNVVARAVAEKLGARLVLDEIAAEVAKKLNEPKVTIVRLIEGKASLAERLEVDRRRFSLICTQVLLDLAAQGDIVIDWCVAPLLLRKVSHVLSVRICAAIDFRLSHAGDELHLEDVEKAGREVRLSDRGCSKATRRFFDEDWKDPLFYDLVLNTGRLSVEECVAEVVALASLPTYRETPDSREKLDNLRIVTRVLLALKDDPRTSETGIGVEAVRNEHGADVTLRGVIRDEALMRALEQVVAAVPGVASVDNRLNVIARARGINSSDWEPLYQKASRRPVESQ